MLLIFISLPCDNKDKSNWESTFNIGSDELSLTKSCKLSFKFAGGS